MTTFRLIKQSLPMGSLERLQLIRDDNHLTWDSRGLLSVIHDWPSDQEISVKSLKGLSGDSANETICTLRELVYRGYLKAIEVNDE